MTLKRWYVDEEAIMWQRRGIWVVVFSMLVGCGTSTPVSTETSTVVPDTGVVATQLPGEPAQPTVVAEATASATAFVVPSSTPSNANAPDATAIVATVQAAMPATPTPDAAGLTASAVGETAVVAIWQDADGPYFAAITTGMMDDIDTPHPLTIYQKQGETFVPVTRYDFVDGEYIGGIELIPDITTDKTFFVVHGGVGAHSSFGTVFAFDGKNLTVAVDGRSDAGGGAVTVRDINSDGVLDIITDTTDYYVFCYACGVRIRNATVYAWDGTAFVAQVIEPASDAATNTIVAYAQAQRWSMVDTLLAQLLPPSMVPDKWNVALMRHMATLRRPVADDAFPLLAHIFYGDYDAAIALLKAVGADETTRIDGSWFAGPISDGQTADATMEFRMVAADVMVRFADIALAQDPTDTSVQFIRGWARTLKNPRDPAGLNDLQAVVAVDPFYKQVRDAVVSR